MKTIKFQRGEMPLVLSDAIVLSDEEAAELGEEDIELMKEQRYQEWLALVTAEPQDASEQAPPVDEEGLIDG